MIYIIILTSLCFHGSVSKRQPCKQAGGEGVIYLDSRDYLPENRAWNRENRGKFRRNTGRRSVTSWKFLQISNSSQYPPPNSFFTSYNIGLSQNSVSVLNKIIALGFLCKVSFIGHT